MALSNKFGALVLTTGNKSELAVGYCTLYGDMCGGLAVISDVPKTMVYSLSRIANRRHADAIPRIGLQQAAFGRTAARSEGQRFASAVRRARRHPAALHRGVPTPREIAGTALPLELVRDIANKVDRNEYKRQQAAPGLKVTTEGVRHRPPLSHRATIFGIRMKTFAGASLRGYTAAAVLHARNLRRASRSARCPTAAFFSTADGGSKPPASRFPWIRCPCPRRSHPTGSFCWC